jgi:Domain of unknown function (DUF6268)
MKQIHVLFFMLIIVFIQAHAQSDTLQSNEGHYCVPALNGMPIGKGASFEYQRLPSIDIETIDKTGNFGNSKNTINSNNSIEAKLKIPLLNKPYLNILGGFKYTFEEYHFENTISNTFYANLEDRGLKSIGANVTVIKPTRTNKFWVFKANADLNGDFDRNSDNMKDFLKFSISTALGWKVNDNYSFTLGISFNYRFGSPLLLPVVAFNKNLNEKWNIEAILPVFVRSRFHYNDGLYWLNTIEIDGASYKLNNFSNEFSLYDNLHLHRSDIQYTTRMEKKVIGWLWVASEVGLRKNLRYNLTNSNKANDNVIFENTLKSAFLVNVSLFISPGKKI